MSLKIKTFGFCVTWQFSEVEIKRNSNSEL